MPGICGELLAPRILGHGYPKLQAILDRGAAEEQLAKVVGENILRVWRDVQRVRDDMQAEGVLPVEDVWKDRTWWRYDGYYQMPDPDPEDKLGLDWYGARPLEEGIYLKE